MSAKNIAGMPEKSSKQIVGKFLNWMGYKFLLTKTSKIERRYGEKSRSRNFKNRRKNTNKLEKQSL